MIRRVCRLIEPFVIEERYDLDRKRVALAVVEVAETNADADVVFEASE